ncbi:hypothetical protein OB931_18605 [Aeromonas media]|uniref:hypothetical protein n=1 Tax=Aeromonas media TaxID=651 RepID=UPI0024C1C644|nr:hypothetical protein [Aeromonas media]MDM5078366.1 hypothetical protein [Aeromonas media]
MKDRKTCVGISRGIITVLLVVIFPKMANAVMWINCEREDKYDYITSIWPTPYISDSGLLCFDVKGWPGYSGSNCAANGKGASWTGLVIVDEDGESQGRDLTAFRLLKPTFNQDYIKYTIEWSRGNSWRPMQHVEINRLTGVAVSYLMHEHGGEKYQCSAHNKVLATDSSDAGPMQTDTKCAGSACKSPEINVFINPEVDIQDGKLQISAETNLPKGSPVMAMVVSPIMIGGDGYLAQQNTTVKNNGSIRFKPFSNNETPLRSGPYEITISTPFAKLQPESVRMLIGEFGENLSGNLVEKFTLNGLTDQTINYKFKIDIP